MSNDQFLCHNDVHKSIKKNAQKELQEKILEIVKNTNDEICGAYGFWEMNSDECDSFDGNCTLCKITKVFKILNGEV